MLETGLHCVSYLLMVQNLQHCFSWVASFGFHEFATLFNLCLPPSVRCTLSTVSANSICEG